MGFMSNPNQDFLSFRMPTWEEDISREHDSQLPFENAPAPSENAARGIQRAEPIDAGVDERRAVRALFGKRPIADPAVDGSRRL